MDGHQLYTDLVTHIPLGLMIWHLDDPHDANTFKLIAVNPLAQEILGLPADFCMTEFSNQDSDPFPAFLKIESPDVYADVIRSKTVKDLGEIRYRSEQFIEKVFRAKAFPLPYQHVGVIFEDITDRKYIEESLKQIERKLLFHLQQTPLAVIEWNLNFEIVEWNPAAEQIFGYSRREALGRNITELVVPADFKHEIGQIWQTLINLKTSVSGTSQNIRTDGRIIICDWHSTPLVDEGGNVIGVFSLAQDVTDRQHTEEALLASAVRYRRLFEASQDGVLILDAETGQITEANPFLTNLLGYSHTELLGKKLWEIGLLQNVEANRAIFQRLKEGDILRFEDLPLVTHDGRQVDVEFISSTYRAGNQLVIQCNIRDMTNRKRAEAELRQFAKRLERSNQELQDFASVASHDLQEPLRKIQAFGDRLNAKYADALSDEGRDYLERMQNAAKRMQILINDLLKFSRITTKAKPFIPVNLNDTVQDVLSDLEIHIQQANGTIVVGDLPTIEADPTQIRQLLQNLISNALKFHQPHIPPHIHIHARILSTAQPLTKSLEQSVPPHFFSCHQALCQLQISDNGIGFHEKYLDRIFTVFQRLHGRGEYDGTGMGLAICRKIVDRHSGHITARSIPERGTTFIVTLPVQQLGWNEGA